MTWSLTSPITGAAVTGFTSPTYTFVSDSAPDLNGKQVAVSALGGTQAGVVVHSGSCPFTITFVKPRTYKVLGKTNPVTGSLPSVPKNSYKVIVRKGATPLAGQPYALAIITVTMDIPAGADIADAPNIKAALSAAVGAVYQQSTGMSDTLVSGLM